jgi:CRISPR-associated endonuclease/helicase Cas3
MTSYYVVLIDIKCGKTITGRLIRENEDVDLLDPEIMQQFYEYYFYDRRNIMDYPTDDGETVYEMLSCNEGGVRNFRNRTGQDCRCLISQAFHTADKNFAVIDKNAVSVVALYGEAEKLIEDYRVQPKRIVTKEKLSIIRKLEKYSVSVFSWEMNALAGAIDTLDDETGVKYLADKTHYSEDVGITLEADPIDLII